MTSLYQQVYQRDGWKCRHCNDRNALHPHHITYRSHGGADSLDNIVTLCAGCHRAHHDGFLDITVVIRTADNVIVRFQRRKGWIPE